MPVRAFAPLLFCGLTALAQVPSVADDAEIRRVVASYLAAVRSGDDAAAMQHLAPRRTRYSPAGTTLGLGPSAGMTARFRDTSFFMRHVHFLNGDAASTIGLWRNAKAKPPFDAGSLDFGMVRIEGAWKIANAHESYLHSPEATAPTVSEASVNPDGILTAEEQAAGWQALFDGRTNAGWVTMTGGTELPDCWRIVEGTLGTVSGRPPNTALRTARGYTSFELSFEWQAAAKANSGVKYRLYGTEIWAGGRGGDAGGFEYQVADDEGDPGAKRDPRQRSGSLYGVVAAAPGAAKPPGEWNESRIVVTDERAEHWLNGVKVAEFAIDIPFASPIVLQHHSSEVRFRRLKIRPR
ncbi:MAG TPA: hypothetical protein DEH78_24225 [Solibacterales bacterium]|nr:hypothetical protein [Bryobacterales bacterium]